MKALEAIFCYFDYFFTFCQVFCQAFIGLCTIFLLICWNCLIILFIIIYMDLNLIF